MKFDSLIETTTATAVLDVESPAGATSDAATLDSLLAPPAESREATGQAPGRQAPEPPKSSQIDNRGLCDADRGLIDRCVAGQVKAWQELYDQFHVALMRSIASLLGRNASDELVEEMASRVWCSLAESDGALLDRYDPDRGARFITFLRLIARNEIKRHFRSENRRRRREVAVGSVGRTTIDHGESTLWSGLDEFVQDLTPAELKFFNSVLVPAEEGASAKNERDYSRSNFWQLRHRIREKLVKYLEM